MRTRGYDRFFVMDHAVYELYFCLRLSEVIKEHRRARSNTSCITDRPQASGTNEKRKLCDTSEPDCKDPDGEEGGIYCPCECWLETLGGVSTCRAMIACMQHAEIRGSFVR